MRESRSRPNNSNHNWLSSASCAHCSILAMNSASDRAGSFPVVCNNGGFGTEQLFPENPYLFPFFVQPDVKLHHRAGKRFRPFSQELLYAHPYQVSAFSPPVPSTLIISSNRWTNMALAASASSVR